MDKKQALGKLILGLVVLFLIVFAVTALLLTGVLKANVGISFVVALLITAFTAGVIYKRA